MSAPPERVAFLVAGVQKGGTTALFDYLQEQPGLGMAPQKEVHFFDDEARDWARPDYAHYHAQFPPAAPAVLRGEATPIYVYWPDSLERIRAYNPRMRLILLFRDPVARAWSHWRMETARSAETAPFSWCIRGGRTRLAQSEKPGFHRVYSYVERGFYGAQLEHLRHLFPPDQLLLLRSRDLDRDPNSVLRRISDFLGAPAPAPVRPRRVHVGAPRSSETEPSREDVLYLRGLFADDAGRFERLSGLRLEAEP